MSTVSSNLPPYAPSIQTTEPLAHPIPERPMDERALIGRLLRQLNDKEEHIDVLKKRIVKQQVEISDYAVLLSKNLDSLNELSAQALKSIQYSKISMTVTTMVAFIAAAIFILKK